MKEKKVETKTGQMTSREAKQYALDLKKYAEKISKSPSASNRFLKSTGIYTDKGHLKSNYK